MIPLSLGLPCFSAPARPDSLSFGCPDPLRTSATYAGGRRNDRRAEGREVERAGGRENTKKRKGEARPSLVAAASDLPRSTRPPHPAPCPCSFRSVPRTMAASFIGFVSLSGPVALSLKGQAPRRATLFVRYAALGQTLIRSLCSSALRSSPAQSHHHADLGQRHPLCRPTALDRSPGEHHLAGERSVVPSFGSRCLATGRASGR
jgi:hypothetical protein